jgi:hypothetical protein
MTLTPATHNDLQETWLSALYAAERVSTADDAQTVKRANEAEEDAYDALIDHEREQAGYLTPLFPVTAQKEGRA